MWLRSRRLDTKFIFRKNSGKYKGVWHKSSRLENSRRIYATSYPTSIPINFGIGYFRCYQTAEERIYLRFSSKVTKFTDKPQSSPVAQEHLQSWLWQTRTVLHTNQKRLRQMINSTRIWSRSNNRPQERDF